MMAPASILYPFAQGLLYYVIAAYTDDLLSELVREAESLISPYVLPASISLKSR